MRKMSSSFKPSYQEQLREPERDFIDAAVLCWLTVHIHIQHHVASHASLLLSFSINAFCSASTLDSDSYWAVHL
jgi:hypothetical protein